MKFKAVAWIGALSTSWLFAGGPNTPGPDYSAYLQLPEILSCPGLISGKVPSEQHFVTASQTQELWFRQILQELEGRLKHFAETKEPAALSEGLKRVVAINDSTTAQLPLLKSIVTVPEFFQIRESFGGASGLQSQQFWRIYARLGLDAQKTKIPFFQREVSAPAPTPSLRVQVLAWLESYDVPTDFKFSQLPQSSMLSEKAQRAVAFIKEHASSSQHRDAWELIQTLHRVDTSLRKWRKDHADLAKYYLDGVPGSAGTAGFEYLVRTIDGYMIFSDFTAMRELDLDLSNGIAISQAIKFDGTGLTVFGVNPAEMNYLSVGNSVLSTREGSRFNVEVVSLNPHCHGTHTETASHIVSDEVVVSSAVKFAPVPALLITVRAEKASESPDTYNSFKKDDDYLITANSLKNKLQEAWKNGRHQALVLRVVGGGKDQMPAYFTNEAMALVTALQIDHLLIDTPSVDRLEDGAELRAHHTYWNVPHGTTTLAPDSLRHRTITELISVPVEVKDGEYLLSIQIPDFQLSVAPSRPVLFPLP